MNDYKRRVLDLLAQGKMTVDEADQLLSKLGASGGGPESAPLDGGAKPSPRFVRITAHEPGKNGRPDQDVNIRVPLAFLRGGMRLSTMIPGLRDKVTARLRERGIDIDLAKYDASSIETLLKDLGELHIDVHEGNQQVRIAFE